MPSATLLVVFSNTLLLLSSLHPSQAPSLSRQRMTAISLEMMKELLAEQAKTILSEIRDQIKAEVTIQLEPHLSRINQLHNEHTQLRKELSDLTCQLSTSHQQHPTPQFTTSYRQGKPM